MADMKMPMAEKYVSEDGEYIIPVQWSVYSTVKVKNVANLAEAFNLVQEMIEDIPIDSEPEFIDGSYQINIADDEELINAQDYAHIGDHTINGATKKVEKK